MNVKHRHLLRKRLLMLTMALVLLLVMIPATTQEAAAAEVSGTIYASNISASEHHLVLTGHTTLILDRDLVLKTISGEFSLVVKGSGSLTVSADWMESDAISVSSLDVQTNLYVSSTSKKHCSIYATGSISLTGGSVTVKGASGIRSKNGNVTIRTADLKVEATSGVSIIANEGSVDIDATKLNVQTQGAENHGIAAAQNVTVKSNEGLIIGKVYGVYAQEGYIEMNGKFSIGADDYGVYAPKGTVTMEGTFYVNGTVNAIRHDGPKDIRLNGDFTLRSAKDSTIYTPGYLYVDGKLDVRCDNSKDYALKILSSINIKGSVCKIDASGGGIFSQYGDIRISSTEIKVTCAVMAGIVSRSQGSVYLNGDQITVLCASPTRDDDQFHNGIYAKGSVSVSVTGLAWVEGREGIVAEEGNISLYGGGEHQVQGLGNALRGQEIRATGTLKVKTTNKSGEPYAIKSTMFAFDGDVLEVTSTGGGIQATNGELTIKGTEITIIAKGTDATSDGIRAENGDLSLTCTNATITGETGIYGAQNVVLNGNISAEGTAADGISCVGNLTMTGKVTAKCLDPSKWRDSGIFCGGNVKFTGSLLDLQGFDGIIAGGNIEIQGSVHAIADYDVGIKTDGSITITGADSVWAETKGKDNPLNDYEKFNGIYAGGDILIEAKHATIMGIRYGIYSNEGSVTLNGGFTVVCDECCAIYTTKKLTVKGDLSAASICESHTIYCEGFSFDGGQLFVRGEGDGSGIFTYGDINITADSMEVFVKDGYGIYANNITIDSDYLWIQNNNTSNNGYLSAVRASDNIVIRSSDATLVGDYGVFSYEGNVDLQGTFAIGGTFRGVNAGKGYVKLNGSFLIQSGNIGVSAGESVVFTGANLNITAGSNCIYSQASDISLAGTVTATTTAADKIAIYAYGTINLNGNVTVTSGGCEGIKAEGTVTLWKGYYKVTGCKTNYRAIYGVSGLTMDSDLKVVVPDGGYNNGYCINTTKGTRATEVEIYAAISTSDVNIYIDTPVAGKTPPSKTYQIYGLGSQISLDSITWYEDGVKMTEGQSFVAGKTYTVDLVLVSNGGELFAMGDMAKVNDKSVSTATGGNKLYLSGISLGKCANAIGKVELTITAPLEGNTPSTTVGANTGYGKDSIQWQVSTDGEGWSNMSSSAKFESGKYYRVIIYVRTSANNYKFATTTTASGIQPNVDATVNGYAAKVTATAGKAADSYITVTYNFGICNDSVVENITITNIDVPVAGQTPDYMANCFGTGYSMAGTNSGNWKVNGIVWLRGGDIYTGSIMDKTEKFQPGHEYTVMIDLVADNGYTFLFNHNNSIYATTSINGNTAQIAIDNCSTTKYQVWYTFTCQQKTVDRIEINDIDYPASGKAPDYTAVEGNSDEYLLDTTHGTYSTGIFWYDCEGRMMDKGEVFRKGETYLIELRIISPQSDGADLVKFANDVRVFINGAEVNTYGWWDAVEVNTVSNTVHVYYTFRQPAQAPEAGVSVMGVVNATGSATKPVVELYAKDDISFTKPLYTATVGEAMPGENGTYNWMFMLSDLPKGEYYLVIEKTSHERCATLVSITGVDSFSDPMILIPVACTHSGGTATCLAPAVCSKCSEPYGEKNSKNHTQEVYWMCGTANHSAYYDCCRTYEISDQPHTWKNGVCSVCGYKCMHIGGTATCTSKAVCTTCGVSYGEVDMHNHLQDPKWKITEDRHTYYYPCCQNEIMYAPHAFDNGVCIDCAYACKHKLSGVKGMEPTCNSDGLKDCYQCDICHCYFEDQAAQKPIDDYSSWMEGAGKLIGQHVFGDLIPKQNPVHTPISLSNGMKAHYLCEVCQQYFDENKNSCTPSDLIIPVEPHSFGPWNTSDPTIHWKSCTCGLRGELGAHVYQNENDMTCDTCGYDRTAPHVHGNGQKVDGQAAGCTDHGWKEYYLCECGDYFADAACTEPISDLIAWKQGNGMIPAQHSFGQLIPKSEADCTKTGMLAHYKCSVCDTLFDENKVVKTLTELMIPMSTEHSYGSWTSNGDHTHTRVCTNSDDHKETLPCSGGTATCTQKAMCETCGGAYGNLLAHEYGTEWITNPQDHWNACACGEKTNLGSHADADKDGNCDTCGYNVGAGQPDNPTQPTDPTQPTEPNQTTQPNESGNPSTPTETTKPGENTDKQDGLGTGAIVAIAVGGTLAICVLAFLVYLFVVKKKT